MSGLTYVTRGVAALALSLVAVTASAQAVADTQKPFEPVSGQAGKDVVWVPTPQATVDKMLDLGKVTPQDYVIDLGSGNGVTVITAAKRGATALGVEFNPEMVKLARRLASEAGVADKATFVEGDLFEADLSRATVITLFLLPDINEKLRPKLLDLKPGTRIVSNSFTLGEWKADQTANVKDNCTTYCTALLWVVPAKVEGTWQLKEGELKLKQQFQMLTGTLNAGGKEQPISKAKLNGDQIIFVAGNAEYTGRVKDSGMEGSVKSASNNGSWSATKK